jgi:tetratricopeptide (TPR) repeat protein
VIALRTLRTLIFLIALAFLAGPANVGVSPARSETIDSKLLDEQIAKLYRDGRYSEAIPLAQQLLESREKAAGPDHPEVASALTTLANLYNSQGRYADAEPLYKRSLSILEHSLRLLPMLRVH